jgi:hypothetical protein
MHIGRYVRGRFMLESFLHDHITLAVIKDSERTNCAGFHNFICLVNM